MNYLHLTQTLVDSFNALADEVQSLTDRKTVLEHKLRFAHEQFQYLADKHAPAAPEIAETLAKLQIPPDIKHPALTNATTVPLLKRATEDASHQIALIIRDGRQVARQLSSLGEPSKTSISSRETTSRESNTVTSMSTALEQDFTVEGKKGELACPFSAARAATEAAEEADGQEQNVDASDPTPHQSSDPICAAMYEETTSQSTHAKASKCPIRYMDKHSPEEIAQYVSKHKHEIPRSHEVCVARYQKNENSIRKLDAKYGSLVNMIEGLSQLHRPMMPTGEERQQDEVDRASNERVENWAHDVSASAGEFPETTEHTARNEDGEEHEDDDPDRQSHFDRPLKEIRVGESPSRPWGISVPVYEPHGHGEEHHPPLSPPPAPVMMTNSIYSQQTPAKSAGKCPFDHMKLLGLNGLNSPLAKVDEKTSISAEGPRVERPRVERPYTPEKRDRPPPSMSHAQPAFLNPPEPPKPANSGPQMVFTGPVFIGYPMDQAIQFMQHYNEGR